MSNKANATIACKSQYSKTKAPNADLRLGKVLHLGFATIVLHQLHRCLTQTMGNTAQSLDAVAVCVCTCYAFRKGEG